MSCGHSQELCSQRTNLLLIGCTRVSKYVKYKPTLNLTKTHKFHPEQAGAKEQVGNDGVLEVVPIKVVANSEALNQLDAAQAHHLPEQQAQAGSPGPQADLGRELINSFSQDKS